MINLLNSIIDGEFSSSVNDSSENYKSPLARDGYNYGYIETGDLDNFQSQDAPPKG